MACNMPCQPPSGTRRLHAGRASYGHSHGILVALASAALALGLLLYLTDRPPGHAMALPAAFAIGGGPLFGAAGQWIPSFIHPFAFSLLSAPLRPAGAGAGYGACAAWWSVNVAFETAQHATVRPVAMDGLEAILGDRWMSQALATYLQRGVFDPGDLAAATLGAIAAAAMLAWFHREENHDATE